MPKPAAYGDRRLVEAMLTPAQLEALEEYCVEFEIERDEWQDVQSLRILNEATAARRLARELIPVVGTAERARFAAASRLGISDETTRTRVRLLRRAARPAKGPGGQVEPVDPLDGDSDSECEAEEDAA